MRKLLLTGLGILAISSCSVQQVKFEYETLEKVAVPRLYLTNRLERELKKGGQTFVNEKILCLKGYKSKDKIVATKSFMPVHKISTPKKVASEGCPSDTVTRWHNHPGEGEVCYLSSVDIKNSIDSGHPIYIVQVKEGYCWWTLKQIEERKDRMKIIPIEDQFRFK